MEPDSEITSATQIYVAKDRQQRGPFSLDEVIAMSAQGRISGSDLAWYEGAAEWVPLRKVLRRIPGAHPRPFTAGWLKSGSGYVGFVLGLVALPMWILIFVVAGMAHTQEVKGNGSMMIGVGLDGMVLIVINAVGAVLGCMGLVKRDERRAATITGLVLNMMQLGVIFLAMLSGMSNRQSDAGERRAYQSEGSAGVER